ncbi:ACT domain-containing protein [Marinicrinis lubricantis]|uniref:UPF0735 ACT domain-containing protein ACFPXP_18930 n=1 Tax=Marinicrinis lubricantis TaxID=2086470 RepID=A0ABW1IUH2_9BACL
MAENRTERYFLVREDILPEAVLKTLEVKQMLSLGTAKTVNEAAEKVGLSRSAFYKYKDGIFPLNKVQQETIVAISMDLSHRAGILSKVLAMVAQHEGNVLTINQTIPLQGVANVIITVDTSLMNERLPSLLEALKQQEGVHKVQVVGQG